MISAAVALAGVLALAPAEVPLAPVASATPGLNLEPRSAPSLKSPWGALGLSLACELPTALLGPSCGHLYTGEDAHFFLTGGFRVLDFLALAVLEKWGPGIAPLYDVLQPHFSRSLGAEPIAYPVDLVLVALWWGTAVYDLVDVVFSARRVNRKARLRLSAPAPPAPGLTLVQF